MMGSGAYDDQTGQPLSATDIGQWRRLPAEQQPPWDRDPAIGPIIETLSTMPPLISADEIDAFARLLAGVAVGTRLLLQAGECAENPAHRGREYVAPMALLLTGLARTMANSSGRPVITVGRIAGQYAKPRTKAVESVGGQWVPSFRGLMVNDPDLDPAARVADPHRMLDCRQAAEDTVGTLRKLGADLGSRVWTSHEALVLDYELPQLRRLADGRLMLTSTHWPWIGDRTRIIGGAHLALMAAIANPVACKMGPGIDESELLSVCDQLDPQRTPGRLTLICRQGAGITGRRLPRLASAVRREGHPVIWLCDPMHGNTVISASGLKTRTLTAMRREIGEFHAALDEAGVVAGGLHLEITTEPVHECVSSDAGIDEVDGGAYTTLCDPRLNVSQAKAVLAAWTGTERVP